MKNYLRITKVILAFYYILFNQNLNAQWNSFNKPTESNINATFFIDATHGWAVGDNATILKYDGTNWTAQTLPVITSTNFTSVYFLNNNLGWVVSADGVIFKFNGTSWAIEKTDGSISNLTSVYFVDANHGWAAGSSSSNIYFYNGTKWITQTLPGYSYITSLAFTDASHGWAVGEYYTGSEYDLAILNFNGTTWSVQKTGPLNGYLRSVAMINNNLGWAVGDNNIIYKFNGTSWVTQTSPVSSSYTSFMSVSFLDSTHGWATDSYGTLIKYNGTSWLQDTILNNSTSNIKLISSNNGLLVGLNGKMWQYNGTKWNSISKEYSGLEKVIFTDSNHGWIISYNDILKYSGGDWKIDTSSYGFYDACFIDSMHGYAVGYGNNIWRYNGNSWTKQPLGSYYNLYSVSFPDTGHGWAVGYYGTIIKYSGGKWIKQTSNTSATLTKVFFTDSLHGWAVGDSGIILKYANQQWTKVVSNTTVYLNSLFFTDQTHGWAVGNNQTILKYNGTNWSVYKSGRQYYSYNNVYFLNNKYGWIVGSGGSILKFDGTNWIDQPTTNTSDSYVSVAFADTLNGWLITYNNIVKTTNGGTSPYSKTSISLLGQIVYPTIWNSDTVKILGNVTVSGSLIIKPGVRVEFEGNYTLNVNYGTLNATGTKDKPINFTVNDSILTGTNSGWDELYNYSNNSGDSTIVKYCIFRNSNSASIFANNTYVDISYNDITNKYTNGSGIYLYGSKGGQIVENTVDSAYYGLQLNGSTNLSVSGNKFQYNNYGNYISSNSSNIKLDTNTVAYNFYLGMYINQSSVSVINSKICNNSYGAFYILNAKTDIINSLISNNGFYQYYDNNSSKYFQGAIVSDNSQLNILNSNITKNISYNSYSGGGLFYKFSNGNVYNSIIWNNVKNTNDTCQIFIFNNSSKPNFYNSDIKGGKAAIQTASGSVTYSGTYKNNLDVNPQFTNPTTNFGTGTGSTYNALTANWKLNTNSNLINQGTFSIGSLILPDFDLAGGKRVLNGVVDIGGYETRIPTITLTSCPDTIKGNVTWASDTVRIKSCGVVIAKNANLVIQAGTMVEFWGPYKIIAYGSIKALGTAINPVLFTIHDTTGFSKNNSVGWEGIEFDNSNGDLDNSDSTLFQYCTFTNAKDTNSNYWYGIGLTGVIKDKFYSKLAISNSLFTGNTIAVPSNSYGYWGLIGLQYSNVKIFNNKFINNQSPVFYIQSSNGSIINNIIKGNNSNISYSPMCSFGNSDITFAYNSVTNNKVLNYSSLIDASSSTSRITNNIFVNNFDTASNSWPYVIYCYNGNMILANNDIVNNSGYGFFFGNGIFKSFNNIVWGNKYTGYYYSLNTGSTISNCDMDNYYYSYDTINKNVISDTPKFVLPTIGRGTIYDGSKANWGITLFSPCVNKGNSDTTGLRLGNFDFIGNARINGDHIDIGAYENQGTKISYQMQPIGGPYCTGDSVSLSVLLSDTATIQWQKDGNNILGANKKIFKIKPVTISDAGNYTCIATNAFGSVYSNSVSIQVKTPPTFTSQPKSQWADQNSPLDISTIVNGSTPLYYQWFKGNSSLSNDTLNDIKFKSFGYTNEGVYKCNVTNSCGSLTTQSINLMISPVINNITGSAVCEKSPFKLSIITNDTVIYQWQKNGSNITGATNSTYTIATTTTNDQGNYSCIVSNSYEYKVVGPILLQVNTIPEITTDQLGSLVSKGNSQLLSIAATGYKPLSYNWFKDGVSLNDTTSKYAIDSFKLADEGIYVCKVSNTCGFAYSSNAMFALAPEICMVTVKIDSLSKTKITGHNLIIWNKESRVTYSKFNIYRESAYAGIYDLIGSVPYNSPGEFEDTVVNPKDQAYLYKITAVDANNNETNINLCPVHKTIHLLTTYGVSGGIQLDWDQYIGFNYGTYYIYRGINRKQFKIVHQMASSTRSWTDFDTIIGPKDTLSYFVSIRKLNGCNPYNTQTKSGDGLLVESVSNMEDNRLRSNDSTVNISIKAIPTVELLVFPNPFNSIATVEYNLTRNANVNLTLMDIYGNSLKSIINKSQTTGNYQIQISSTELNLKDGIYVLRLKCNDMVLTKRLVFSR
jgi:photosystem II stability/assembly factor-like uncharacterized protein